MDADQLVQRECVDASLESMALHHSRRSHGRRGAQVIRWPHEQLQPLAPTGDRVFDQLDVSEGVQRDVGSEHAGDGRRRFNGHDVPCGPTRFAASKV